jgi:hypothetical protein
MRFDGLLLWIAFVELFYGTTWREFSLARVIRGGLAV